MLRRIRSNMSEKELLLTRFKLLHNFSYCKVMQVCLGLVLAFVLLHSFAMGQVTSGTISGIVKDSSGAVIPKAAVTATNGAIGLTRNVTATEEGTFFLTNLPPGTYSVSVEAQGFKKLEKSGLILSAADRLNAGVFVMTVGGVDASVVVTADNGQLQLQSNSGERSDLITSKQLNDVALNGRNVLDYMKLVPGVSGLYDGHASSTGGNDAFNINGTRANQHEFTIDGASNVDTGNNGGTHITINPDAIEEVKVLTSNYQAEYGKAAGGQIAITTKSGTNEWHGNGRFFHRHEGLNANEYFNKQNQLANKSPNTPPLYRYNYSGYSIGGPILKNRLFVFWNQEFYEQYVPLGGVVQFYTPTALERQGDFSQSVDGNGNKVVIAGPGITNNKINPSQLPAAQQTVFANMQKLLNLYPQANVPGFGTNGLNYNFSAAPSSSNPRREDILRVDYQINNSNRIYGRWVHNSETQNAPATPFPGPFGTYACSTPMYVGGCTQKHPGWNFSLNLVSTITPTILNEVSVGPSHSLSLDESSTGNFSLSKLGIKMPLLYPSDTVPDLDFGSGMANTNYSGSYLGATPWKQANTTINANDNLTWSRGTHIFKGGVFYQRNRKDQIAWGNMNGELHFDIGATAGGSCNGISNCVLGDPIASALLGSFKSFDQSTARPIGKFRYNQVEFYVQDTWKATQKLTLDYGVRFAWIPPQIDDSNQLALFDPASYVPSQAVSITTSGTVVPNSGNTLNGMRFSATGQLPKGGWSSSGIMAEPRIGFAWDPYNSHKTIVRGGAGMMHDRTQGNLLFNTVFNNPAIVQKALVSAGNISSLSAAQSSFGDAVLGGIVGADLNGKVPTVYSYSVGIQQEISSGTTLDLAYVGTISRHLVTSRDINAIPYGYAFSADAQDPTQFPGGVVPAVEPNLPAIYANAGYKFSGIYAKGRNNYTNAPLVPFKGYDQISYLKWDGTSNYSSLQVSLQRRFSKGLTFGAVYTWSKSMTTSTSDQDTQNPVNAKLDYRAASWDRTHVFAANYVYDLPSPVKSFGGPHWLSYITDNYQLSGVTNAMTGTPVDMGNNFSFESGALDGSNMWGAIQYYYALDQNKNPVLPSVGMPIRGSRDTLRQGGIQNWDMSLFKKIPVSKSERYFVQLRLEAFNVFNHPNFKTKNYPISVNGPWQWQPGTPLSITKAVNWGTNASTYNTGPGGFRVVQLGAKFNF